MQQLTHLTDDEIEAICQLAEARKRAGQTERTEVIRPSTDRGAHLDALMTRGLSPEHLALLRHIQTLPKAALLELTALAWFGRGDAPFERLLRHATDTYSITLPYYLADKLLLADYLRTGLRRR